MISARSAEFPSTHWSVVLAAGQDESPQAQNALARLCEKYWYPLYAYIRRRGHDHQEAQDLTQDFFSRILEKRYLKVRMADHERGKFRSFLLTSLNHFLADDWDRKNAQKRGEGRVSFLSELTTAEGCYQFEPSHECTAEQIFERRWALTLLEEASSRLQEEWIQQGKEKLFEQLKVFLATASETPSYHQMATVSGMTEGAIRLAVHRLRRQFRELLRKEIAHTVERSEEIEEEIHYFIRIFNVSHAAQPFR